VYVGGKKLTIAVFEESSRESPEALKTFLEVLTLTGGGKMAKSVAGEATGIASKPGIKSKFDFGAEAGKLTETTHASKIWSDINVFADKTSARNFLQDSVYHTEGNKFFKGAKPISKDLKIAKLDSGNIEMSFFDPADTPGYGKKYILELDKYGNKISHYRQTIDPSGKVLNTKLTGKDK
jgi:hypothetical protein